MPAITRGLAQAPPAVPEGRRKLRRRRPRRRAGQAAGGAHRHGLRGGALPAVRGGAAEVSPRPPVLLAAAGQAALGCAAVGRGTACRRGGPAGPASARGPEQRHGEPLHRVREAGLLPADPVEALDGRNPAAHAEMRREQHRERYLAEAELRALFQALAAEPNRTAAAAIALLAASGAWRGAAALVGARRPGAPALAGARVLSPAGGGSSRSRTPSW